MRNAFVALIASVALSGCVSRSLRLDQPPENTALAADRVPLVAAFTDGRPYVDLRVNGAGPFRFLVDTGSEGSSITREVARAVGISFSRGNSVEVVGSNGQSERQFMAIVDRMESPGVSFEGMAVTILTAESAALLPQHGDLSNGGIIGMSALRNVRLEIDYPQRKISVVGIGQEPPPGLGIPYTENRPYVTLATPSPKHATITAVVDTGADGGFYLADIASYPARVGWVKADAYSQGIGGDWRPLFGQMAGDLRVGSATWRDPVIHSAARNRIGSAELASWKLVIDQQRKTLWLLDENQINTTTWTGPLEPDGRPSVLGIGAVAEEGALVIQEVDPGSRAELAGLKIGDRIVSQCADVIRDRDQEKDTYLTRLQIVRGRERLEITLTLSKPLPTSTKSPSL